MDTPNSPGTVPVEADKQQETPADPPPKSGGSEAWIGGAVWLLILVVGGYFWLYTGRVDVLLNVSGTNPLVVEGVVTSDGAPVPSGTIQVLVEDPREDRLLASAATDVTSNGTFRAELHHELTENPTNGLRIRSNYHGRITDPKSTSQELKGTSTVYMNMTPPWGMNWGLGALVLVLGPLVWLFTGPLPPRKARLLFGVTYVVTFSACVIPIVLTIAASRSPALVETMRGAPVGIVKAKAKGLEEAQWLVNIGGSVNQISPEESGAGGRLLPTGPPTAVVSIQTPPTPAPPIPDPATSQTVPDATASTSNSAPHANALQTQTYKLPVRVEPRGLEVKGGLVIPLYVILLAMLGAGINMTRKVPQIQTDYDSPAGATWSDALSAPLKVLGMAQDAGAHKEKHQKNASVIRQDLIETYMYFVSAPFLAVAVYYLLQIVASSVAEPVLVVIAFASGLMSESAVGAIMAFADDFLKRQKERKRHAHQRRGEHAAATHPTVEKPHRVPALRDRGGRPLRVNQSRARQRMRAVPPGEKRSLHASEVGNSVSR
jgi:hypothetical protein